MGARTIGGDTPNAIGFRLSRIYAQGWNAGRRGALKSNQAADIANPYASEPERAHWDEGFRAASGA